MTRLGLTMGTGSSLIAVAALVWASNVDLTPRLSNDGVLRLTWRIRPERLEHCREQTPEALARLPPHMRRTVVCEGATAAYRLDVRSDGMVLVDEVIHGGGLRQDRPLYVSRDLGIRPGSRLITVRFDRVDETGASVTAAENRMSVTRAGGAPASLAFEEHVTFRSREVVLVTYDEGRRALVRLVRGP